MSERERQVKLREERNGRDSRHLWAWVDAQGRLHVDGQDLGPSTATVSSDGEYEWFQTIAAEHVPRLIGLLGGKPGNDLLDLLEARWTGARAADFEKLLRESGIPVERVTF
ncbi:MAG TPA: hypothetical protein VH083_08740 [Myxococcales bacterium]|jgi:hypothetical protein|nr:hypothetical protein [Myxococcales bacterium]